MVEKVEQRLLATDNSLAAIVYSEKVEFPEGSYFNRISSLDVPEFASKKFNDTRIVTREEHKNFREAFMLEVERRLLQQGYHWEK